jgi:HEPN domain-containing protein
MAIDAETYRAAAKEHVTAARVLYDNGHFALAHYVAGLAVECILRAYRARVDGEFDSRHDLKRLSDLAKFAQVVPQRREEAIGVAFAVVLAQWSNEHRFRSVAALRKYLTRLGLYRGVKGDFVKECTRRIVNAASEIVALGVTRWTQA